MSEVNPKLSGENARARVNLQDNQISRPARARSLALGLSVSLHARRDLRRGIRVDKHDF